jgi:hypothetical protein
VECGDLKKYFAADLDKPSQVPLERGQRACEYLPETLCGFIPWENSREETPVSQPGLGTPYVRGKKTI